MGRSAVRSAVIRRFCAEAVSAIAASVICVQRVSYSNPELQHRDKHYLSCWFTGIDVDAAFRGISSLAWRRCLSQPPPRRAHSRPHQPHPCRSAKCTSCSAAVMTAVALHSSVGRKNDFAEITAFGGDVLNAARRREACALYQARQRSRSGRTIGARFAQEKVWANAGRFDKGALTRNRATAWASLRTVSRSESGVSALQWLCA